MAMFEDSGVSFPNEPAPEYPTFTGPGIDMWNQCQLDQAPGELPKERHAQDIADEVVSRLLKFGATKDNSVGDRVAALEAAWRVYADFARLSEGK